MTASKKELAPAIAVGNADRLPAIITRASARLMKARDSAEVLEAKQTAEAALHFAKLTKATNETHADCLRIITRAEMRMADEIEKGQACGTISKRGRARKKKAWDFPGSASLSGGNSATLAPRESSRSSSRSSPKTARPPRTTS
jgi:hypothetical protein